MNLRSTLAGMDRRLVLGGGLVLGSLAFTAGPVTPAIAAPAPLAWTPRALSLQQAQVLDAAAELIIPETDTPGARRAGVPQFVDRALADYYPPPERQRIARGLDQLDADARAAHGAGFAALNTEQQTAILNRHDAAEAAAGPGFFATLRDMVTTGYFTSEPGATLALRYDPVPGEYRACVPLSEIGRAWATS
ncbi:gluconate 2-dehydrogenase subunit 3 family protein [Phenylobacterium sp.]|uniref:gluconate 2-dehydrogenase subunit 3 family protein n=1 Tax=Phenylobacterium sp. TaxID=1871053 RepID=UPI003BAA193A